MGRLMLQPSPILTRIRCPRYLLPFRRKAFSDQAARPRGHLLNIHIAGAKRSALATGTDSAWGTPRGSGRHERPNQGTVACLSFSPLSPPIDQCGWLAGGGLVQAGKDWIFQHWAQAGPIADELRVQVERFRDWDKKLLTLYLVNDVLHHALAQRYGRVCRFFLPRLYPCCSCSALPMLGCALYHTGRT